MPEKTKYNLVDDSEDSFQGFSFQVKFIGTLDIVQPQSRLDILAAMRRVRYEFKVKNIKKTKVYLVVAVDGVRVVLRKKKTKDDHSWDESQVMLAQDPIYRIFYVSHDSQDLKIFSYIAKDKKSNVFRCNVFKSKRKSQAMRIVQTVGQAFEVCHQQSLDTADEWLIKGVEEKVEEDEKTSGPDRNNAESVQNNDTKSSEDTAAEEEPTALPSSVPEHFSLNHRVQLLQKQLKQQEQKCHAASAQAVLLQQQLCLEARARAEAQTRAQQLLQQNGELLQHLSMLITHIQELELRTHSSSSNMGSQDSLLEIALRSNVPRFPPPTEPDLVHLDEFDTFREPPDQKKKPEQDRDSGQGLEEDANESSPTENGFFGALEISGFRESGIASGYESNTDESDDRDSWGQ